MIYYTISSAHPADASDMNRSDYTLISVVNQRHSCLKVELRSLVSYDFSCRCSKKTRARTYSHAAPAIPVSCLRNDRLNLSPTFHRSDQCPMNYRSSPGSRNCLSPVHTLSAELSGFKHGILLSQDTTLLLHVLPTMPASLYNVVRLVWTGKSAPDGDRLRSQLTVRREIVYNALQ